MVPLERVRLVTARAIAVPACVPAKRSPLDSQKSQLDEVGNVNMPPLYLHVN